MSGSGSLSKPQVHSRSGSLTSENFEALWRTVKVYMCTLSDTSPILRGPNFGSTMRIDSPAFTRDLTTYFTNGGFGNRYWAAGSGTEFIYPVNQKEIMSFFRIVVVTIGGSIRQNRKRTRQKRAQVNRETQQPEDLQSRASVRTTPNPPTSNPPTLALPTPNVHSMYITNPDESDDKVFEASLNDEEPRKFLVSPLSITFNEFFARFCECWNMDIDTVDMDTLQIKAFIVDVGEYTLDPSNLPSAWRSAMKVAEGAPDSRIQISIVIHE